MIKKGFTLQELLITMGIIGIVAALTIPGVISMMPDKNKTMYMKAYNTLTTLTDEILGDSSLYWPKAYDRDGLPEEFGMYADDQPLITPYNNDINCQGTNKFPAILSHRLSLAQEAEFNGNTVHMITTDGIDWTFETSDYSITGGGGLGYMTDVTINVDPQRANSCKQGECAANVTPNLFTFLIDNDGGVYATDDLGIAYLENPTDMHAKSKDASRATELSGKGNEIRKSITKKDNK